MSDPSQPSAVGAAPVQFIFRSSCDLCPVSGRTSEPIEKGFELLVELITECTAIL